MIEPLAQLWRKVAGRFQMLATSVMRSAIAPAFCAFLVIQATEARSAEPDTAATAVTNQPAETVSSETGRRGRDRDRRGSSRSSETSITTNGPATLETSASTNATGLDAFKIVTERNIFNATRGPRSSRSQAAASRKAPNVETFALGGTMSYDKGPVAFFVSSSSQYRKSVRVGDSIAGYLVKEIQSTTVRIENGAAAFELKVGEQLKREDEGAWIKEAKSEPIASSGSASAPGTDDGAGNDILKRLLEKRQKELNP